MVKVADYIDQERIFFLDKGVAKSEVLSLLIDSINSNANIIDTAQFRADVYERESLMSTGIGLGIAIPHCKSTAVKKMVIAIAIAKEPFEYNALDGKPVQFVVMIAAGKDQYKEYLTLLSKIAFLLKNRQKRERVIAATSSEEIYTLFSLI